MTQQRQDTSCGNCRQPFTLRDEGRQGRRLPLMLQCGDSYCSHCIKQMGRKTSSITCPRCGVTTPFIPEEAAESQLVPNFYSLGIVTAKHLHLQCVPSNSPLHQSSTCRPQERDFGTDLPPLQNGTASEDDTQCDECSQPAQVKCIQCTGFFCDTCFQVVHAAATSLRRHTTIPAMQASSPPPSCADHKLIISYYCLTEQVPLCAECIISGHKEHNIVGIREAAESHTQQLQLLLEDATAVMRRMMAMKKLLISRQSELHRASVSECKSMQTKIRELHTSVQRRELELHRAMSAELDTQMSPLQEVERTLTKNIAHLSVTIETANEVMKNDVKLLQNSKKLSEALRDVEKLVPGDIPVSAHVCFRMGSEVREQIEKAGSVTIPPLPSINSVEEGTVAIANTSLTVERGRPGSAHPSPSPSPINLCLEAERPSCSSLSPLALPFTPKKASSLASGRSSQTRSRSQSRSPSTVPLEETVEVWVSHTDTPGEFYIQVKEEESELQRMSQTLNDLCSHSPQRVEDIYVGVKLAAMFPPDEMWYRAEVTSTHFDPPPAYVTVQYLDYGNVENVTLDKLTALPSSLSSGPFCCYKCRLANLQPPGRFQNVAPPEWSQKAITQFKTMVMKDDTPIRMKEHSRDQFGWMHVDLFLPSLMNSLTSVSESLLQMGLAVRGKRRDAAAPKQVPPPNLPSMGETVEVIVPTAISPAEFYVQLSTNEDTLKSLTRQVQEQEDLQPVDSLYKGMVCIARYSEDNQYYRAVVTDIPGMASAEVHVKFMDYGNAETVQDLWELPSELVNYPVQAIHCCLNDVVPMDGSTWPKEVSDRLFKLTGSALLMEVCSEGLPLSVLLTDKETSQSISAIMVTERIARYAAMTPPTPDPSKKKKRKKKNKAPPPKTSSSSPPAFSPLSLQVSNKPTPTSPPQTNTIPELPLPPVGKILACKVVQVNDPGLFFIQPTSPSEIDASHLTTLLAKVPAHQPGRKSWAVGENCLATFEGKKWFRALVVERLSKGEFKVLYVDYGNEMVLGLDELAIMPPTMRKVPALAMKACLAGVRPLGDHTWRHDTALFFSSLVLEKEVTVTVQAHPLHPSLPLIVSINTNGLGRSSDVSSILLASNRALPFSADFPLPPSASSSSLDTMHTELQAANARTSVGPDKNLPVLDKNPSVHLPVMDKSPSLDLPVMDKSPSSDLPGLDKSPSVLDKSLGYKPAIPLSQGQVFDFSVTHVEEGIIYGHLMDKAQEISVHMLEMQMRCQALPPLASLSSVVPGHACCARFAGDGQFYRALLVEIAGEKAKVKYVDFGNSAEVSACDLVDLALTDTPLYAVGVQESCVQLDVSSLFLGTEFKAEVVEPGDPTKVRVLNFN